jgi:hypothetical protein
MLHLAKDWNCVRWARKSCQFWLRWIRCCQFYSENCFRAKVGNWFTVLTQLNWCSNVRGTLKLKRGLINRSIRITLKVKWFDFFTALAIKIGVFWDMTSCNSCNNQHFGGTYCVHHQGEMNIHSLLTFFLVRWFFPPWGWRRYIPP